MTSYDWSFPIFFSVILSLMEDLVAIPIACRPILSFLICYPSFFGGPQPFWLSFLAMGLAPSAEAKSIVLRPQDNSLDLSDPLP